MSKNSRQAKILEIIAKYDIDTQEELVSRLNAENFKVTQATISRDIKDLALIKTLSMDGTKYRYAVQKTSEQKSSNKFLNIFKNTVTSIASAGNLIVVKTISGTANSAAEFLDRLKLEEVAGLIAGDNTIFIAVTDVSNVEKVSQKLKNILEVESI